MFVNLNEEVFSTRFGCSYWDNLKQRPQEFNLSSRIRLIRFEFFIDILQLA